MTYDYMDLLTRLANGTMTEDEYMGTRDQIQEDLDNGIAHTDDLIALFDLI